MASENRTARLVRPYVCAGTAACFASTAIHPIDVTKVRLQIVPPPATAFSVASKIVATEGPRGLYAGLSAAITRQATYGTARIGLHSSFSDSLKEWRNKSLPAERHAEGLSLGLKFASSFVSGAIASCIGNPFDVSLVRMQADTSKPAALRHNYKGVVDAITTIVRKEGFSALYRGYPPTLLRAIAMNVGQMMTYDEAKERIVKVRGDNMPTWAMASVCSSISATILSLPFDMMKTRLQNMQPCPKTGELPYKGVLDCAQKILKEEGIMRFWRGYGAYLMRCSPHGLIILVSREYFYNGYDAFFGLK